MSARPGPRFREHSTQNLTSDALTLSLSDEVEVLDPAHRAVRAGADRTDFFSAVDDDSRPLGAECLSHAVSDSSFVVPSEALEVGSQHLSAKFDEPIDVPGIAATEGDCHRDSLGAVKSETPTRAAPRTMSGSGHSWPLRQSRPSVV